jgi:5-formyltetrahydrofolate cyclo-ligase
MADPTATAAAKAEIRRSMRTIRRSIVDVDDRSGRIWSAVSVLDEVVAARRILAFSSIAGEPDTGPFIGWAEVEGKHVRLPDDALDPRWPDVVIVPCVAFTRGGDRLGQGGGWYDRMLAEARADCLSIGVGFAEQLVDDLPIEDHDVGLDMVVTDDVFIDCR